MVKKISTEDLEIGMVVTDFNSPWLEHPFFTSRRRIRTAKDIDTIRSAGIVELFIDTSKGLDGSRAVSEEEAARPVRERLRGETLGTPQVEEVNEEPAEAVPFEEELRKAREIYEAARVEVRRIFEEVRLGGSVDGEKALRTVEGMIASIFRNRDALLSLSRIKSLDQYTFEHSINVAVLSLNLGSHLGILDRELLRLGVGALLHDLGKLRIQQQILQKPGRLTDAEMEVMRTHSAHGARIILQTDSLHDDCAAVALNHHERYDGSGYPRALEGLNIGKFGLIAAVADVFDAMTSDRVYQARKPPHQVLQRIFEWGGTLFHPLYVQKFVQCVGIYPIGTAVQLDTGELGVVCRENRDHLTRPWVRVHRPPRNGDLPEAIADVDLRDPDASGEKPFARSVSSVVHLPAPAVDALLSAPAPKNARYTVVLG